MTYTGICINFYRTSGHSISYAQGQGNLVGINVTLYQKHKLISSFQLKFDELKRAGCYKLKQKGMGSYQVFKNREECSLIYVPSSCITETQIYWLGWSRPLMFQC